MNIMVLDCGCTITKSMYEPYEVLSVTPCGKHLHLVCKEMKIIANKLIINISK